MITSLPPASSTAWANAYYLCWPRNNNRGRADKYEGHPKTVYIREDELLRFYEKVFSYGVTD